MIWATTIVFARADLSIPGAPDDAATTSERADATRARFFDLVSRGKPDVIVLDFSNAPARAGTDAILSIRQRIDIPILVVCNAEQSVLEDFRIAGAADCISVPLNVVSLNQAIQRILRVTSHRKSAPSRAPENFSFAAMSFYPGRNRLVSKELTVDLTSSEARLLAHLASKPWTLCSRSEIGELLYGREHNVGDRAIDIVVNRLRKKLTCAGGEGAEQLIKTEFRRGYLMAAEVGVLPRQPSDQLRTDFAPAS